MTGTLRFKEYTLKRGKGKCSKVIIVLIHQAIGFGVSAAAAGGQLIVSPAAGHEASAGRRQDDEDVLLDSCQMVEGKRKGAHAERLARGDSGGGLTETKAKMPAHRV